MPTSLLGSYGPMPAQTQADLALQRGEIRASRALERSLLQRTFNERTVPDLINHAASGSDFYSGSTTKNVTRSAEDLVSQFAGGEIGTQLSLADLLRNQFLVSMGLQL